MTPELGPGAWIDSYRLVRLLGHGSQSSVYLAEHQPSAQVVALKLCPLPAADPDERAWSAEDQNSDSKAPANRAWRSAVSGFKRVSEAILNLPAHPHIVSVLAAGISERWAWLAMEVVSGGDLQRYTRPARLLPEPLVLQLAQQIATALAHAHQHGLVHRDLKPANVLLHLPTGVLKLADFGLARGVNAEPTATGLVPGTPAYMAPEQLAGQLPTPSSDLYALGVILYELLSGRRPHEASTMGALLHEVASRQAILLADLRPELPDAVCNLVHALLEKRPGSRLSEADVVAKQLAILATTTDPSGQSGP